MLISDLTFSTTFGKNGSGEGQFNPPHGIACDSTGKVYVADTDNNRIQVFTAEREFLWMFWRRGLGRRQLNKPLGVALDACDICVCSHRVSVFKSGGQFVTSFGELGAGPGKFDLVD